MLRAQSSTPKCAGCTRSGASLLLGFDEILEGNIVKKSLITCAAVVACMTTAQAQNKVEVSGLVDLYAGSIKLGDGQGRTSQVGSGGMTTSWWGLNGSEDLGGGLKASFALGAFFRADNGEMGRFNGDAFFARDANIALSGSFGTVKLGRSMAPNFLPTILFNAFGDSFTVSPLVLHADMHWPNASFPFDPQYRTTAADTGWSNQITYSTPSWGGLSANLHYQFGEQSGSERSKKNVGANLMYFQGPLALTAFIERAQVANPDLELLPQTKQNWMLGGSYNLDVVKLYATYGQSEWKNSNAYEAKTTSLGLDVPVSAAGTVKAAAAYTKVDAPLTGDAKRTTVTLGYDHFLSKRTDAYTAVMYDKQKWTSNHSGTSAVVGIRHRF